jgi:hypothetical protein
VSLPPAWPHGRRAILLACACAAAGGCSETHAPGAIEVEPGRWPILTVSPFGSIGTWPELGPWVSISVGFERDAPDDQLRVLDRFTSFELDGVEWIRSPELTITRESTVAFAGLELESVVLGPHTAVVEFLDSRGARYRNRWRFHVLHPDEVTFEPATLHPTEIFDLAPPPGAAGPWNEIGPRISFRLEAGGVRTMELDGEDVFNEHQCFQRGPLPPCGIERAELSAGLHAVRVTYTPNLPDGEIVIRRVEWDFTVTAP